MFLSTNQRETTIVWERSTGRPVANAIVWQSRVTAPAATRSRRPVTSRSFRARTGLPIDAYFSGPKIAEILDRQPGLRARAERGELAFGTVDTFLDLAADRRPGPRHRRVECQPDAAVRHPPAGLGRRAAVRSSACRRRCCPRCAARRAVSARPSPSCSAGRSRSPGSPATSRRRRSARRASRRARPR